MTVMTDRLSRCRISAEARVSLGALRDYAKHLLGIGAAHPEMRMTIEPIETPSGEGFIIRPHHGLKDHVLEFIHMASQNNYTPYSLTVLALAHPHERTQWSIESVGTSDKVVQPVTYAEQDDPADLRDALETEIFNWILKASAQIAEKHGIGSRITPHP